MASKTRNKRTAPAFQIPQTRDQVSEFIHGIGEDQRELARIQADMQDELAMIREKYEARAQPIAQRIQDRTAGVQVWCDGHRAQLTQDGKTKTARFAAGDVLWRNTPPACTVRNAEGVMDALYKMFGETFLRLKREVNKDAILATALDHPVRKVEGITISQREEFVVQPFETELAEGA